MPSEAPASEAQQGDAALAGEDLRPDGRRVVRRRMAGQQLGGCFSGFFVAVDPRALMRLEGGIAVMTGGAFVLSLAGSQIDGMTDETYRPSSWGRNGPMLYRKRPQHASSATYGKTLSMRPVCPTLPVHGPLHFSKTAYRSTRRLRGTRLDGPSTSLGVPRRRRSTATSRASDLPGMAGPSRSVNPNRPVP